MFDQRTLQECPYRQPCDQSASDVQQPAVCDLLVQLTGVQDKQLATVAVDACTACCKSFLPTERDWNAAIPSLVVSTCTKIVGAGGVEGCSTEQAAVLKQKALSLVPLVLPDQSGFVSHPKSNPALLPATAEQIAEVIPLPNVGEPDSVNPDRKVEWAVGVTTHPRRLPTISMTLEALTAAGWDRYRVFHDGAPDTAWPERDGLPGHPSFTVRDDAIGPWSNWFLSLIELYQRFPHADAYLVLQDDALPARLPGLRGYLDQVISAMPREAILSLYTSSHDTQPMSGWNAYPQVWELGALAFVFLPAAIAKLVRDETVWELHRDGHEWVQRGVDPKVGKWAHCNQIDVWHPTPSIVQHIGDVSAIWKYSRAVGRRRASSFLESHFESEKNDGAR